MKNILEKFKKNASSPSSGRAAALVALALLLLFALYYVGVFDVSFLVRPASWDDHADRFYSIWDEKTEETAPETDGETEKQTAEERPDVVSSVELDVTGKPPVAVPQVSELPTREALAEDGLYLTDGDYVPGASRLGRIIFPFELPREFSYRDMDVLSWDVTSYNDGRISKAKETVTTAPRPAIYLYMGYIIYDDCGIALYLIDKNGAVLMEYDPSYIPAFARDRDGRPLFCTPYSYYADVPATDEVNEAGEHTFTYRGALINAKNYYTVGYGGGYFAYSDYVEERDGRGLNFDFPAGYGISDAWGIYRAGIMSPKYSAFLDGTTGLVNFMNWGYFSLYEGERPDLDAITAAERAFAVMSTEQKLEAIKNKTTPEDVYHTSELFPYSAAYNYSGGYATVVTSDVDEEPKYEASELRVINTAGNVMFTSRKKYVNPQTDAFCSDRFMLPLTRGEESVGHLYFDRGYMRLRKVSFDKFQLDEWGDFRVNSDVDVLVTPYGREFGVPDGFSITGYADGVVTLCRAGVYGYFRTDGSWIADPVYKSASAFHGGIGVLCDADGKYGAVDTDGNVLIPFKYDYISNNSDGLIAVHSEKDGWETLGVFAG